MQPQAALRLAKRASDAAESYGCHKAGTVGVKPLIVARDSSSLGNEGCSAETKINHQRPDLLV